MSPYRIELYDADGVVVAERTELFEHDDDAIDHVGRIDHADALQIWQGPRLVAHFPTQRPRWR